MQQQPCRHASTQPPQQHARSGADVPAPPTACHALRRVHVRAQLESLRTDDLLERIQEGAQAYDAPSPAEVEDQLSHLPRGLTTTLSEGPRRRGALLCLPQIFPDVLAKPAWRRHALGNVLLCVRQCLLFHDREHRAWQVPKAGGPDERQLSSCCFTWQ